MARWDHFLNGLTGGYGEGYDRGKQYQVDQRGRDVREAGEAVSAAYDMETPQNAAIPIEQTALEPVITGYEGGATTPVQVGGFALDDVGDRQGLQGPVNPKFADQRVHDAGYVPQGPAEVTQEGVMQLGGSVTGPQTVAQMDQLHTALKNYYTVRGDFDKLGAPLNRQMDEYRQDRIIHYLDLAQQSLGRDPQAAAEAMHNAYGYYPDGQQAMFTMRDGQLMGYGFDEDTNKFKKKMVINSQSIAAMAEQVRDPAAFNDRVKAENIATMNRNWERAVDARDYHLEVQKFQLDKFLADVEQRSASYEDLKNYTLANKYMNESLYKTDWGGFGGSADGQKMYTQFTKDLQLASDSIRKDLTAGTMPEQYKGILMDEDGRLNTNLSQVGRIAGDVLHGNRMRVGVQRGFSAQEASNIAFAVTALDGFYEGLLGKNSEQDRAWREENSTLTAEFGGDLGGEPRFNHDMTEILLNHNGREISVSPGAVKGLHAYLSAKMLPEGAAPAVDPAGAPTPHDRSIVSPNVDFAGKTAKIGGAITDFASRNVVEPVANWMDGVRTQKVVNDWTRYGRVDEATVDWLLDSGMGPNQMEGHGLPPDLIEYVMSRQSQGRQAIRDVK